MKKQLIRMYSKGLSIFPEDHPWMDDSTLLMLIQNKVEPTLGEDGALIRKYEENNHEIWLEVGDLHIYYGSEEDLLYFTKYLQIREDSCIGKKLCELNGICQDPNCACNEDLPF